MVAAKLQIEAMQRRQAAGHPIPEETLQDTLDAVLKAIESSRQLMHGLLIDQATPEQWQQQLRDALAQAAKALPPPLPHIEYHFADTPAKLPGPIAKTAYLVLRETIWNALRHSGAKTIHCRGQVIGQTLRLEVSDDGCGFEAPHTTTPGRGLAWVPTRIQAVHGTVQLESQPGSGTRWQFDIPLPFNDAPGTETSTDAPMDEQESD